MTGLDVYCATCGHHQAEHLDDHERVGPCGQWLFCSALVHICTCPAFVPLAAAPQHRRGRRVNRTGIVIVTDDAEIITQLVRVGCAAINAMPSRGAIDEMRRRRMLRIGRQFLDDLDPDDDTAA